MDLNFKKIYTAWITSYNPNAQQKLLAEKRNEICSCLFCFPQIH